MAEIEPRLVEDLIDGMAVDFPAHVPGTRPIHTKGIGVGGVFRASRVASTYCVAPQFSGRAVPATVRFSNGNGQLDPDGRLQVRGMAVKLHPDGEETDLVCMSVPMFMAETAAKVLDFERAYRPKPVRRPSLLARLRSLATMCPLPPQEVGVTTSGNDGIVAWCREYQPAQAFIVANSMQRLPVSYARLVYHAVHAFDATGDDGTHRMVRFSLEPADGARDDGPPDPSRQPIEAALKQDQVNAYGASLPPDHLQEELRARLGYARSRFSLRMQIGDPWDDSSDPTTVWPTNRRRVFMGTLTLTHVLPDQVAACEELSFNPGRLLPGLAMSDDPVLRDRVAVYERSFDKRMEARRAGCPVA